MKNNTFKNKKVEKLLKNFSCGIFVLFIVSLSRYQTSIVPFNHAFHVSESHKFHCNQIDS